MLWRLKSEAQIQIVQIELIQRACPEISPVPVAVRDMLWNGQKETTKKIVNNFLEFYI